MDKYDTIIKLEEIRKLVDDDQYIKAEEILDTMNINKIKSLTDLSIIADVYIQNERYDEAYGVLSKMYLKTKTRRILYQLVEISIRRGDLEDAEDYLSQYIKTTPNDYNKFIFRYRIDKQKKMPYEVLIYSLEQLKEYEYIENWAYELAKVYHKAGMKDKCIRECSDIILWFGDGIFVEKAKLLKGYYVGEINPTRTQKTKHIKEEEKLELEKTKDYSAIREDSAVDYEKILGYFYSKEICKDSITNAMKHILDNENKNSYLIISGEKGSGKSQLARNLTKILYDTGWIESSKIAKINGDKLNNISVEQHFGKLKNSTLLIEEAGLLNDNGVDQLKKLISELQGHLFVILEDQPEWIEELLNNYAELKTIFIQNIVLPMYTAKDLFHFANDYIEEQDYQLSTEAEIILLNKSKEISELSNTRNQLSRIFEIVKKAKLLADERYKKELRKVIGSRNIIKTDFLYITADDLLV